MCMPNITAMYQTRQHLALKRAPRHSYLPPPLCRSTSTSRATDERLASYATAHLHTDQQGGCLVPAARCGRARQGGAVQVHQPAAEPLCPRRGAERRVLPRGEARREHVGARGRAGRQETSCRALQGPAKPQVGLLLLARSRCESPHPSPPSPPALPPSSPAVLPPSRPPEPTLCAVAHRIQSPTASSST